MSVGLAHAHALQVSGLEVAQLLRHACEDMQNAYPHASEKVCILRNDPKCGRMQNAYMAKDANHLAAWRTFRHLTQAELAEKVDTTKAVISNLETGARGLSDKWLRRLAPALGTSPGMLLDHDPNDLPTDVLETWAAIPEESKAQALRVLESFRRTGTER
ncbi:helix-turn-helix domain-containing protein [Brevundimonas faecalis]|uniref:helix-turn-helix domain-containing protein n=1 Tax=Brevundimonas faecalis TaxID=947378 RepID=UPI00361AA83E